MRMSARHVSDGPDLCCHSKGHFLIKSQNFGICRIKLSDCEAGHRHTFCLDMGVYSKT